MRTALSQAKQALPDPARKVLDRPLDRARRAWRFRQVDACLVSYPKCGRTWLRMMAGEAIRTQYGVDVADPTDIYAITRQVDGVCTAVASHDDNPMHKALDELETDKSRYRRKRVIFLVRDPRDVAVSSYFHHTARDRTFDGSLGDFLAEKRTVEKVCRFYRIWDDWAGRAGGFLAVRYEDMHADPAGALVEVLRFLGVDPDPAAVELGVEAGQFDRMREVETSGGFGSHRLAPGSPDDPESFKTRRGVVGGFGDYMTASQAGEATRLVETLLGGRFGYGAG